MFRFVLVFFVLLLLAVLVPRYDLYERESVWSEKYVLRHKGYWTVNSCRQDGKKLENEWRCETTNTWDGLWGHQNEYTH